MITTIKHFFKRIGLSNERDDFDESRLDDPTLSLEEAFRLNRLAFEKRWYSRIPARNSLSDFEVVRTLGRGKFGRVLLARLRHFDQNIRKSTQSTSTSEVASETTSKTGSKMTSETASTTSKSRSETASDTSYSSTKSDDSQQHYYEYYALKVMKKRIVLTKSRITRVLYEKKILQCLERFPFVVNYVCHFKDNANLYLVLGFEAGGDMLTHIRRHRRFDEELTRFYASQIVISLEFLHSLSIVHRDIKPENMVIGPDGFVKLTDFGLAKRLEEGGKTATKCGTRVYMAPEVLQMKRTMYSFNVDWWSAGVTIYEMIVGRVPYEASHSVKLLYKIMKGDIKFPEYVPDKLIKLLSGLLEPNIRKRFVTVNKIKRQSYFADVNWQALYHKQINPPYIPTVKSVDDTSNFKSFPEEQIEEWEDDIYEELFKDF